MGNGSGQDIEAVLSKKSLFIHLVTILIRWEFPCARDVKVNTDGCWDKSNDKAGFGEVFIDCAGDWVLGFYGTINSKSSLEAEFWAICRGLTTILEKGMLNVKIKSCSLIAISS